MNNVDAAGTAKLSAYDKRKAASIPAPLETDSDSDFNTGTFVYESKKPNKSAQKGGKKEGRTRLKRARKSGSDSEDMFQERKKARSVYILEFTASAIANELLGVQSRHLGANPLLEFFGRDLDLLSASEEEEASMGADDERDDEGEDDSHPFDEGEPLITKATVGYGSRPQNKLSVGPEANSDSVTESETEPETESEGLPQAKKAGEDSVTESDDEPVIPDKKPPGQVADQEDSVTEPETEDELGGQTSRIVRMTSSLKGQGSPRPGFSLSSDQQVLGPHVLDGEECLEIPGPINTYLREYQRDGVKFFWNQFRNGLGGLLGDDMGLVRTFVVSYSSNDTSPHSLGHVYSNEIGVETDRVPVRFQARQSKSYPSFPQ
ncbi:hypothetical protein PQX77_004676 [Marasmius sp. AFHP31]|nr:hypothetical protein PQX77_004676 [Marasmius sp. AFHP31]